MRGILWGVVLVGAPVLGGCIENAVRERAAAEFHCPESAIQVTRIGGTDGYHAEGCDHSATFVCIDRHCMHDEGPSEVASEIHRSESERESGSSDPSEPKKDRPPSGAAGFKFGADEDAVRDACEGAGHAYSAVSSRVGTCDGTAGEVGAPASVRVIYCAKSVCGIALEIGVPPKANVMHTVVGWRNALARKYGEPARSESEIPPDCEDDLGACIADHRAKVHLIWSWPKGYRLVLSLQVEDAGAPEIVISYEAPAPDTAPAL